MGIEARFPFDEWMTKAKNAARRRLNFAADDDVSWLIGDEADMRAAYDEYDARSFHPEDYVDEQISDSLS